MKPTFKTTAVAILVALGVTACGSDPKSSPAPENPQQINNPQDNAADKKQQQEEEAKKKAEADKKAKEEADKKTAEQKLKDEEAAKKAKEEQERLAAEQKAKEEADKKAKEEQDRLAAEQKRAEQDRLAAEQKANKEADTNTWRRVEFGNAYASGANIYDPRTKPDDYSIKAQSVFATNYYYVNVDGYEGNKNVGYAEGYTGVKEDAPVHTEANAKIKLDYYQLAINDKNNPQVLGLHQGSVESADIEGSEVSQLNSDNLITERTNPHKVNYIFNNTPYATYGAVYNKHAATLFANYEQSSGIGRDDAYYKVGDYEGNNIKFNDAVKGSATYKGDVIAQVGYATNSDNKYLYMLDTTPKVDGTITFNANFGSTAEDTYASAILNSNTLGQVEFTKAQMDLRGGSMDFAQTQDKNGAVHLTSRVVGKEANEIVGMLEYNNYENQVQGNLKSYKAVFSAEKQAK